MEVLSVSYADFKPIAQPFFFLALCFEIFFFFFVNQWK